MKKTILSLIVVILSAGSLMAGPRTSSNTGLKYLAAADDAGRWSVGAYYDVYNRNVTLKDTDFDTTLKSQRAMAYAGYDLNSWITAHIDAGTGETDLGDTGYGDSAMQYGVGMNMNLINHEVADTTLMEDRFTLNADWDLSFSKTENLAGDDVKWGIFNASLTAGIVNDIDGYNTFYTPDSIALFAGPVFSSIIGSDLESSGGGFDQAGICAGAEIFYTTSVSFNLRYTYIDDSDICGGVNVRF
jgi:hypothetical protein